MTGFATNRAGLKQNLTAKLIQGGINLIANFLDFADAFNPDIFGCRRLTGAFPVFIVINQRLGLSMIDIEPVANSFFLVILPLDERFAGNIILALLLGRIKYDVVSSSAGEVNTAVKFCLRPARFVAKPVITA